MKKKRLLPFFIFVLLITAPGCATIIHGSRQEISISSNPSAAKVTIDNFKAGVTPFIARLSRKRHHLVRIQLPGYLPYEMQFTRKVDFWIAGNLLFGGLIGIVIDVATGSMYKLTPQQVQADLKLHLASVSTTKDGLYLAVVLTPAPHWKKIGQLERATQ